MFDVVIVRYGELALKSNSVRNWYEKTLVSNIEAMLHQYKVSFSKIEREWGRIFIHSSDIEAPMVAAKVFGVVSTSPAMTTDGSIEAAAKLCTVMAQNFISEGESFAIRTKRTGNHDFSSHELGMKCGDAVWSMLESNGITPKVDLSDPDKEIFVEMRQKYAYVFTRHLQGVGGLPIGTQGKMVVLISGGIDSPVAAWLMMKRGVDVIPVYCNNDPYNDDRARQRTMDCIKQLRKWCPGRPFKAYEVPLGKNLRTFIERCDRAKTCLLCKRMMYRLAFEIMNIEHASGIITGSSLGQVASQTAANMHAEVHGLCMPLYHPLIGMDKEEIVNIAKKIGTYDISIMPAESCAAVPQHPEVKAKFSSLPPEEEKLDIKSMVQSSLEGAKIFKM